MTVRADVEALDLVAACLEYPGPSTASTARSAADRTAGDHIALAHALWGLATWLETAAAGEAEEHYTALFDLDPVCTPHVGYQVFGDSYPRGAFLAGIAAELRKTGVPRGDDLPDFLPTVLRLLGRLGDAESRRLLVEHALLPALGKMADALAGSRAPWAGVVRALPAFVACAAEGRAEAPPAPHPEPEVRAHA